MRGMILALALICMAFPAAAATCRYTQQAIPDAGDAPRSTIQILDGEHLRLLDAGEAPLSCRYNFDDFGGHLSCPGFTADQAMMFAGKTIADTSDAILIFRNTAWYRDPKCKP